MEARDFQLASRIPPQDVEAEQALLGALLLEPHRLPTVRDTVRPGDFYERRHADIFRAVCAVADRGQTPDLVTVTKELGGEGFYLGDLTTRVGVTTNAEHHAAAIASKATLRASITGLASLVNGAYDPDADPLDVLEDARRLIAKLGEGLPGKAMVPASEVVMDVFRKIEARANGEEDPGISTGFAALDQAIGGLRPRKLYVVAGRPAMGKSAMGGNLALNAAMKGHAVAIFSLEMDTEEYVERFFAAVGRVDGTRIRDGALVENDWGLLSRAAGRLESLPIFFDDTPALTLEAVRAKLQRIAAEQPLGVVVVDYLQLMTGDRRKGDNRQEEVASISRGLKAIAKDYNVAVVALAQLSRANETRGNKEPQLSDLRESGQIEQDADVVAFLHRPEYYGETHVELGNEAVPSEGLAFVLVRKVRGGTVGSIPLHFQAPFTRFEPLAKEYVTADAPF